MVKMQGCPLEEAIRPVTENVAKALRLYPAKGVLASGSDADLLLLDDDLQIREMYAMGKCMLRGGQMQVHVNFEE